MKRRKGNVSEYVIVDGYNIIGASPELQQLGKLQLEEARHQLQEDLSEYGAYTERKVILVFDAHLTKEAGKQNRIRNIDVYFTKKGETADHHIEKLVTALIADSAKVYVATSDALEQHIVFGKGALRISARELLMEIKMIKDEISRDIAHKTTATPRLQGLLHPDVERIFESWRRK